MNNEKTIKILEELVKEYKEEKEFVGKELIDAIETLIAENKELKEMLKHRIEYTNKLEKDLFQNASNYVIPKSKLKAKIEEYEKDYDRQDKEGLYNLTKITSGKIASLRELLDERSNTDV